MTPEPDVYVRYLERTRWFAGKGRPFEVSQVHRIGEVPGRVENGPRVVIQLVEVRYGDDEGGTELYQVPLAFYTEPESRLLSASGVSSRPRSSITRVASSLLVTSSA